MLTKDEAKLRNFIISQLRGSFRKYFVKYEVLNEAATEKKVNIKTGRVAQHYRCNACKGEFVNADVQIDHKIPVTDTTKGFVDWNEFIGRLFCNRENLQCLCKGCHRLKTNAENKERKRVKK